MDIISKTNIIFSRANKRIKYYIQWSWCRQNLVKKLKESSIILREFKFPRFSKNIKSNGFCNNSVNNKVCPTRLSTLFMYVLGRLHKSACDSLPLNKQLLTILQKTCDYNLSNFKKLRPYTNCQFCAIDTFTFLGK